MVRYLNDKGFSNLILVDDFTDETKQPNLFNKRFLLQVPRENFFDWLNNQKGIDFIFHFGARTDTTEFDYSVHQYLNVEYSQKIWTYCVAQKVPLIYASSAATYGSGKLGYSDDHEIVFSLKPLNPYGVSKNEFDKWVLQQNEHPPFWAGLKFFNVYGPNEYHKGRMASVVFHAFNQMQTIEKVKLFKSYRPDFQDGQQLRDFIYIKDVIYVCYWLMNEQPASAIYNVGTGRARSFEDLAKATFTAAQKHAIIEYVEMPEDIRDTYQYFTEAKMEKLRIAGYRNEFTSLEDGIRDYVDNYLLSRQYY
ncbi:MAG: ADP-glyceromanno-heptose 6-epimerase [Chitinophagaceae bacterium]|nr:ADP-glyceromanno-heptose 6-epimerase [Chitinophagaceae bacterium]